MNQSARILLKKYPDEFTGEQLEDHINDLLDRFQNRALRDTVFRVGSDLKRKLGPEDRLTYPLREGLRLGIPADRILYALVCGFYFRAKDENGSYHPNDQVLFDDYPKDIALLLGHFSGFDPVQDKEMISLARSFCKNINTKFTPEIKLV
jgi:mannitol-1-phosphate 5-dehydrogenase